MAINDVIKTTETYDITTIRASVGQYLLAKYISNKTDIKVILNGDGADEAQMGYLYFYNNPNELEAQIEHYKLLDNIHYFDGLRVDRNISSFGLEARVPFLDKEFVNYYRNIESYLKVPKDNKIEKYLIRKSFDKHENDLLP
jgi:asparagine synthase (glutamine-hydrolysing)